jgi:hypothetical protein
MSIAWVRRVRRRPAARACAALACLVLAGCGGGGSGTGANAVGAPENPSFRSPGSGPGTVPAEDVAEVKQALQVIRACRRGRTSRALHDAVTTVVLVYEEDGPEAHYESNDTFTPTNMRDVATQVRAALQRCGAARDVGQVDAVLGAS